LILNKYKIADFPIGIIIRAIKTDSTYYITKGNLYEITNSWELRNSIDIMINFKNDNNGLVNKAINGAILDGVLQYPFDEFFEIL